MEEQIEELAALASKMRAKRLPIFVFQEGRDPNTRRAFKLRWR
jgi:hypothetical protein